MRLLRVFPLALVVVACSEKPAHERVPYAVVSPPRDWAAHPAIATMDAPATIYALSDVHGGYDRMLALLAAHHVIAQKDAPTWSAGTAALVVVGDVIDKGPQSLEALDLVRSLEPQAAAVGGRVIFTMGNHEAEFLDDPANSKASKHDGVDEELRARGLDPVALANGSDPRGTWLRDRPFGARVGAWFFAHAGDTHGRSVDDLERTLQAGVLAHDYDDAAIVGGDSILESQGWYSSDDGIASRYAMALGAKHIVFGHDPNALGPRGEIAVAYGGALFRIDCGLSPDVNDSEGKLLRIRRDGSGDVAESLAPDGTVRELWRGP